MPESQILEQMGEGVGILLHGQDDAASEDRDCERERMSMHQNRHLKDDPDAADGSDAEENGSSPGCCLAILPSNSGHLGVARYDEEVPKYKTHTTHFATKR
jgi:hypothetical protein